MWKAQALEVSQLCILSADLGDLFNFWKLLISTTFFFLTFLGALGLLCATNSAARKGGSWSVRTGFPPSAAPLVADTGSGTGLSGCSGQA